MPREENSKCYEMILNYNCNARCSFCSQGSFDKSLNAGFKQAAAAIYAAYRGGYRRLGLTGGEPLVRPDIVKVIALARSVGFKFIRVQTNGIKLSDAAFCRRLAAAGLTFCKFSLTSDRPSEHDRLVGVPGAWEKAARGVRSMRALKVRVGNNILVSRANYRRLPEITGALLKMGVTSIVIIYPAYIGAMADNIKALGVSLGECEPYFDAAVRIMERAGLGGEMLFLNVPPCFLKGRESMAIGLGLFNTVVTDPLGASTNLDQTADAAKVRAPACRRCRLKDRCAGVDKNYARNFGFAGFKPIRSATQAAPAPAAPSAPAPSAPPAARAAGREPQVFSDNELCLLEILKRRGEATTAQVLAMARDIVLCRDCSDGNSVLNAAQSLDIKGFVESVLARGRYYWRLKKNPGGRP